jgi:predicted nucleic acid-binding protein
MAGITLDTGALIGLERRERRMLARFATWTDADVTVTAPSVVVAEWWRGQKGPTARLLDAFTVEPTSRAIATLAGEALAELRLGRENTIDAIVMASAASRGDVVYTSDFDDLTRLATYFPSVRVLGV